MINLGHHLFIRPEDIATIMKTTGVFGVHLAVSTYSGGNYAVYGPDLDEVANQIVAGDNYVVGITSVEVINAPF